MITLDIIFILVISQVFRLIKIVIVDPFCMSDIE